ncbi:MAG: response regulator [Gammaproteobacteria bacterium]|nr:response regulator [Gammaproteobacteria bacterium]MDH4254649.1 response regulator [Gammaproteobacteria bacterium]MDH5308332.1 response regulator [Gammaproteobacteria bacterium]
MHANAAMSLIIEDEAQIRSFLRISFEANGYSVLEARLAEDGLLLAGTRRPDLVVLDLGLPDMDGSQVIERLREWSDVPILILSARHEERDKVRALDAGANDYVTKPAGIHELMARVRVLLHEKPAQEMASARFEHGELQVDLSRREVQVGGAPVALTRKEYELLRLLVQHAGRVVTHQQMLKTLWGPSFAGETHYLRVLVSALRQKLGDDPSDPRYIVTEQGVGYRLLD